MATTFDEFPIVRDFETLQDADWSRTFTYKIDGTPVNLTGYSAELVVFDEYENAKITITTPTNIVLGGAAGTITPKISNTATNALTPGAYRFNLFLVEPDGDRLPFLVGRFTIRKAVSA